MALFGLIGFVVGIVWTAVYRIRRRSLQAPAVLAGLAIVASLQAGILIIEQPSPKTYPHGYRESEQDTVQTAMYNLMADQAIVTVEPPPDAQNDFSGLPEYGGTEVSRGPLYEGIHHHLLLLLGHIRAHYGAVRIGSAVPLSFRR